MFGFWKRNKSITQQQKACLVAEWIVSGDFAEELSMRRLHKPVVLTEKETEQVLDSIASVYRITHAANNHGCSYTHGDWRQELESRYKEAMKAGFAKTGKEEK